jgi:hypothetical protein
MVHIVFQEADVEVLQKAFELDETLQGDIIEIKDDYAVGPVENIYTEEGYQQRRDWIKQLIDASPYNTEHLMQKVDDKAAVERILKVLEENEEQEVWLWMGQNQHDVCGYYWLISQLQPYQGRIFVLYLNNLPFINEKGQLFYPYDFTPDTAKRIFKSKKTLQKITPSEFEVDPDEWRKLISENAFVRILEGGKKIVSKEADFYDKDILSALTTEWQKGNKAMHNIQSKMKIKTGDIFLLWRMKQLVQLEQVEINGDTSKGWKDFEVRLKSLTAETVISNPDQQ